MDRPPPIATLQALVEEGALERLHELARAHAEVAAARRPDGVSLLCHALYHGQHHVAALFASLRPLDLVEAAALGRVDRVGELLSAAPAEAARVSPDGLPVLTLACFFGHAEVAARLLAAGAPLEAPARDGSEVRALHAATVGGRLGLVHALLRAGAEVEATQADGASALHLAAGTGQARIAALLLEHGADPQARDADGRTPRDRALALSDATLRGAVLTVLTDPGPGSARA